MGEAKYRQQNDPNYGRLPKNIKIRGIVISPPMKIEGNHFQLKHSSLDPQELRFWLLFWDKLVWPSSRIVNIVSGPDEEFLIQEGILERPEYSFSGDIAQSILRTQLTAFSEKEHKEPGQWAFAQGENSLQAILPEMSDRGLLITLHQALPIPSSDVPFDEILQFKEKRFPELYALRDALDTLYLDISKAPDKDFARTHALNKIDNACADLIKVNKEWGHPKNLVNINLSIPLSVIVSPAISLVTGVPIELTAAAGLISASSFFSAKLGKFGMKDLPKETKDYRYAVNAYRELQF